MDRASVLGVLVGLIAILGGNALEGGDLSALLQPTAALVVLGGTLSACLVSYPMDTLLRALRAGKSVFVTAEAPSDASLVEEMATYALIARREGIIALEDIAHRASHPFLAKALSMAIDGVDSKVMRENLELMLDTMDERGEAPAKVWESAGGYAPTIGIIGAVMGLIHVMQNLRDVSAVGSGIAVAFVATIYGVALANLLFLPAAGKLRARHRDEMMRLARMLEGAIAIQEGQNPNVIRGKLSFITADVPTDVDPVEHVRGARAREAVS